MRKIEKFVKSLDEVMENKTPRTKNLQVFNVVDAQICTCMIQHQGSIVTIVWGGLRNFLTGTGDQLKVTLDKCKNLTLSVLSKALLYINLYASLNLLSKQSHKLLTQSQITEDAVQVKQKEQTNHKNKFIQQKFWFTFNFSWGCTDQRFGPMRYTVLSPLR